MYGVAVQDKARSWELRARCRLVHFRQEASFLQAWLVASTTPVLPAPTSHKVPEPLTGSMPNVAPIMAQSPIERFIGERLAQGGLEIRIGTLLAAEVPSAIEEAYKLRFGLKEAQRELNKAMSDINAGKAKIDPHLTNAHFKQTKLRLYGLESGIGEKIGRIHDFLASARALISESAVFEMLDRVLALALRVVDQKGRRSAKSLLATDDLQVIEDAKKLVRLCYFKHAGQAPDWLK